MIPLRDANPTRRTPWITYLLIAANVAIFFLWQPLTGSDVEQQGFFLCEAQIPWEVTNGANLAEGGPQARLAISETYGAGTGGPVQRYLAARCPGKSPYLALLVSMFLHGSLLHIGGNMLYLWIFGNNVEDRLGRASFLVFYLLGGLAASALQMSFDPGSTLPSLGASGAIGAVLGAYLVLFPGARVTTLVMFIVITVQQLPAVLVLGIWFVLQFFSGVGQIGQTATGGVAYWAHVGGFAFGALAALLFYRGRRGASPIGVPPRPDLICVTPARRPSRRRPATSSRTNVCRGSEASAPP
ncbi:MAG: rhomboid family intramembrane serine protease, partial [Actinomycetota bacterium]